MEKELTEFMAKLGNEVRVKEGIRYFEVSIWRDGKMLEWEQGKSREEAFSKMWEFVEEFYQIIG